MGGLTILATAAVGLPEDALASGGQYGLAEGRIISLAHPVVMGGCFLLSLGSAYTGYQWRRIRDIGAEITDLKATLKGLKAALDTLKAIEEPTAADTAKI